MNTEKLRLREPGIIPTQEVLEKTLGDSHRIYEKFVEGLRDLGIENEWKFYPCFGCKAWMARGEYKWVTPRGTKKSKNIYWLSAWDEYFVVSVWFKEDNRAEVLKADVREETKLLIRKGKMFGPKMRTFPVEFEITSIEPLDDIFTLLKYKIRLETH